MKISKTPLGPIIQKTFKESPHRRKELAAYLGLTPPAVNRIFTKDDIHVKQLLKLSIFFETNFFEPFINEIEDGNVKVDKKEYEQMQERINTVQEMHSTYSKTTQNMETLIDEYKSLNALLKNQLDESRKENSKLKAEIKKLRK